MLPAFFDSVVSLVVRTSTDLPPDVRAAMAASLRKEKAPSQSSLTARSAQSLISNEYIRNYTSPVSDYSQVLQMAPGSRVSRASTPETRSRAPPAGTIRC